MFKIMAIPILIFKQCKESTAMLVLVLALADVSRLTYSKHQCYMLRNTPSYQQSITNNYILRSAVFYS